jgi:hypothetical protein
MVHTLPSLILIGYTVPLYSDIWDSILLIAGTPLESLDRELGNQQPISLILMIRFNDYPRNGSTLQVKWKWRTSLVDDDIV